MYPSLCFFSIFPPKEEYEALIERDTRIKLYGIIYMLSRDEIYNIVDIRWFPLTMSTVQYIRIKNEGKK